MQQEFSIRFKSVGLVKCSCESCVTVVYDMNLMGSSLQFMVRQEKLSLDKLAHGKSRDVRKTDGWCILPRE